MLTTYGERIGCITAFLVIFTNLLRSDSRLDVSSLKELSTLFSFFSTKATEEEDSSFGFILAFFFRLTLSFRPLVTIFRLLEFICEFAPFSSSTWCFVWIIPSSCMIVEEEVSCKDSWLFSEIWSEMLTDSMILRHSSVGSVNLSGLAPSG